MFRAPQWHGATQTHFPPRPRKSQWRCNITNRRVATRSAHTLEANMSHDTTNHPAHQRHATFTPACFALPSGTAPSKRTFHQGRANHNGTATSRTSCPHTVCPHTRSKHITFTTYHPARQRHAAFTPACFALPSGTAPRKNTLPTKAAQIPMALQHHEHNFATWSAHTLEANICKTSVSYETLGQKSHVKFPKQAFRTRLPQKVTRQVSKTSVSYETSSKTHMSKSAKRAFRTRPPPKVKRKHPSEHTHHAALPSSFAIPAPPNNTRPHANPNVTATFTSTKTHNLTIPCACHKSFRVHTSNAHKALRLPRNVTPITPRNLTIPVPAMKIALPHLKARTKYCACHEK